MLAATAVITKVEYNKQLFEFTKKFVSKSNRKTFIPRTKDFLKRNKKKILIIFLVLFGIVAISFAVRGVQYSQKNAYAASLPEELQGKTYIHYYNSSYRTEWEVYDTDVIYKKDGTRLIVIQFYTEGSSIAVGSYCVYCEDGYVSNSTKMMGAEYPYEDHIDELKALFGI